MKSPLLIIFIIFNLLTINLVSAGNLYGGDIDSQTVQVQKDAETTSSVSEPDCDHFCHISSHMVGFISVAAQPYSDNAASTFIRLKQKSVSLSLTSPSQPPKA
jgi:hypothetical protein